MTVMGFTDDGFAARICRPIWTHDRNVHLPSKCLLRWYSGKSQNLRWKTLMVHGNSMNCQRPRFETMEYVRVSLLSEAILYGKRKNAWPHSI